MLEAGGRRRQNVLQDLQSEVDEFLPSRDALSLEQRREQQPVEFANTHLGLEDFFGRGRVETGHENELDRISHEYGEADCHRLGGFGLRKG